MAKQNSPAYTLEEYRSLAHSKGSLHIVQRDRMSREEITYHFIATLASIKNTLLHSQFDKP